MAREDESGGETAAYRPLGDGLRSSIPGGTPPPEPRGSRAGKARPLTDEDQVQIAIALLFYLREWDEPEAGSEHALPTKRLVADAGELAGRTLDRHVSRAAINQAMVELSKARPREDSNAAGGGSESLE